MRKSFDNFRENHGNAARIVLFQMAALLADRFLFWPRPNATVANKVGCAGWAMATHVAAFKFAQYLNKPTVQPSAKSEEVDTKKEPVQEQSPVHTVV